MHPQSRRSVMGGGVVDCDEPDAFAVSPQSLNPSDAEIHAVLSLTLRARRKQRAQGRQS